MLSRDASSQAASRAVERRRDRPPHHLGRRASCAPRLPSAPPPPEMDLRMPGRRGVGEDNGGEGGGGLGGGDDGGEGGGGEGGGGLGGGEGGEGGGG